MMAGAPGASGSLVIFDSSGDTGWKPPPAFSVAGWYVATPSSITIANDQGANRRPIDIAQLTLGISLQSRPIRLRGKRTTDSTGRRSQIHIVPQIRVLATRQYSGMVIVSRESPIQCRPTRAR